MASMSVPLGRFEQLSVVGVFGSAGWPFGLTPGREELAGEAGGEHAGDMVGPSGVGVWSRSAEPRAQSVEEI